METMLGLMIGVGLSAACGFRVFVPLLGASIAAHTGFLQLSPDLAWLASWPAMMAFLCATLLEVGAYYVPWLDNLMDSIASPLAVAAGAILTASMIDEMSPLLRWSLALIAGGGSAGLVQLATVGLRAGSSSATGGFGNFFLSTIELFGAAGLTVITLLLPVLGMLLALLLLALGWFTVKGALGWAKRRASPV
ncbi:DUF4126 domain-containing protein [Massilia sp. W12]|uniref:DUF4126 domain-containing protein n=1 Tax=Massilia sp. W12 TaxID=3126507 RepID=UPI0030CB0EB9